MKLGSLFDGIGGFPLAGSRHGITPVWASEIEAGPMAITKKHFPDMIHLGDVTKIDGAAVEPVDVITFGSPCQDLSVAGKRAGLDGARSGLFMEAVRIIKEMRDATDGPRFAVWENVPGAFSSNSGEDFRVVLEELCRVKDPTFTVPSSKWEPAGLVEGDGWSVAWRVLDAQYWGVPQRRKRIFVVADFGGSSAGKVLFECESLRRYPAKGEGARQGIAADIEGSVRTAGFKWGNSKDARSIGYEDELSPTLAGSSGENMVPAIVQCIGFDHSKGGESLMDKTPPLRAHSSRTSNPSGSGGMSVCFEPRSQDGNPRIHGDVCPTLNTAQGGQRQPCVMTRINCQPNGICGAMSSKWAKGTGGPAGDEHYNLIVTNRYMVRRLMPLECERLQGFDDYWTDGHSDTTRYKALGNSVAEPCVEFVLEGIVREWVLS